jgi:hypothetical protein
VVLVAPLWELWEECPEACLPRVVVLEQVLPQPNNPAQQVLELELLTPLPA